MFLKISRANHLMLIEEKSSSSLMDRLDWKNLHNKEIIKFLGNEKSSSDLVQFHPSYGYEEFIEGSDLLHPRMELNLKLFQENKKSY